MIDFPTEVNAQTLDENDLVQKKAILVYKISPTSFLTPTSQSILQSLEIQLNRAMSFQADYGYIFSERPLLNFSKHRFDKGAHSYHLKFEVKRYLARRKKITLSKLYLAFQTTFYIKNFKTNERPCLEWRYIPDNFPFSGYYECSQQGTEGTDFYKESAYGTYFKIGYQTISLKRFVFDAFIGPGLRFVQEFKYKYGKPMPQSDETEKHILPSLSFGFRIGYVLIER